MSTEHEITRRTPSDDAPVRPIVTRGVSLADGAQVAELAVELRTLLGLRTRTSARDRPLPTLTSLLPPSAQSDPDARFAALTALLEEGIAAMPDADHSTAADALLGSGPGRWRPLSARGLDAAQPFGCGWDAYRRRRRSTDTSLLEETVDLLARTIVELADPDQVKPPEDRVRVQSAQPAIPETTEETPAAEQPPPVVSIGPPSDLSNADIGSTEIEDQRLHTTDAGGPKSRKTRILLAAGVVALIVAGVAAAAAALLSGADDSPEASCGSLDQEVGATPVGADADLAAWTKPFEEFVASEGLTDVTRCASHMAPWTHGAIQRVRPHGTDSVSALIGSEVAGETVVVHLTWSELRAFGRATSTQGPDGGAQLGETLGAVVGRSEGPGGEPVVEFTDGLLVTEPTDAPTYAIAGAWVEIWNESGGIGGELGLPLTDRRIDHATGGLFQQFERGTISSTVDGQIQVAAAQDHFARALPEDPRNQVLVATPTDSWWYVDAEGIRHYVATSDDQTCLQWRMGVPVLRNQPIAAIASLPAGDQFQCP